MRDIGGKLHTLDNMVRAQMQVWLERAEQIWQQRAPRTKGKLYALHPPEVECIGKGKARTPYEFGVKVGIAITATQGLIVGARSFVGNPYDGDTLSEQIEQVRTLVQDTGASPKVAIVDLGYRGREVEGIEILHCGKAKSLTRRQWCWIRRR